MMTAELRLALCDASNFVVEQAAKVAREHTLSELVPDLVSAYHRFLNDGVDCDKGCRAKLAIVEALLPLDFEEPDFWLAGMQYRQQEPVWNGSIDTATDLRGVCAFGLVRSRLIAPSDLLIALTDLLADSEFVARAHAARAIAAAGLPGSAALLRCCDSKPRLAIRIPRYSARVSRASWNWTPRAMSISLPGFCNPTPMPPSKRPSHWEAHGTGKRPCCC